MRSKAAISRMMKELAEKNIRYVRFELPDTHGISRCKVVPISHVESYATTGLNFYGGVIALDTSSAVVGGSSMNEEQKYRDQHLFPDPDTVQVIPWLDATAKVICDTQWAPGEPIEATPRQVLRRVLEFASDMGYEVTMGHEFEFYLLDGESHKPLFGGAHIFNNVRNHYVPFLDEVLDQLAGIGIDVITHNCEYSPSQFEINFGPSVGMAGADKAFTFKNAIKELAHRAGYLATFMTKPATDMAGCGCHVHMGLVNRRGKKNVFQSRGEPSKVMLQFTQGILDHAMAVTALGCPTINCYHRLKPHTFAPSNVSWGEEDRTAMVRLIGVGTPQSHIEMRAAAGMSNPYLSAAVVLAAGLLGIKGRRRPQPVSDGPSEEDTGFDKLPQNLDDAIDGLQADRAICKMLGDDFVHVFTTVKRNEIARFRDHVTDWERNEYLELY